MSVHVLIREQAIQRLRHVEAQIRGLGVSRLALFGSVARNEAREDSDVDVLVGFARAHKSFDRFMARADLSPYIGQHILAEAMDVLRAA
jgi:predicted nucleotidyltransferase